MRHSNELKLLDRNLLRVAGVGDVNVVSSLLTTGANPCASDSRGWTPLHIASQRGRTDVVAALLAAGANPNVRDKLGMTARMAAADHPEVIATIDRHQLTALGTPREQTALSRPHF